MSENARFPAGVSFWIALFSSVPHHKIPGRSAMNPRAAKVLVAGLAAAGAAIASAPQPAPTATESGVRSRAATCGACHGTLGRPVAGSTVAGLAGRTQESLVDAMRAFQEGKGEATVMHQLAKGYSDAEI